MNDEELKRFEDKRALSGQYMFKMYVKMQDTEFKKLIQEFRRACK